MKKAKAFALEVLADRLKHGEDLLSGHRRKSGGASLERLAFTAA